jgi:DNA-binding transcriptional LysR family regulator
LSGVSVLGAVVEGGSFVKAAELLGITDSGISRAISRLEGRLSVRLLDRTTRSATPTGEGRRFYDEVKPHLNAIEDAAVVASGAASAVRGRLKVDIDPFFLPLVLAGRLGAFCELYPQISPPTAACSSSIPIQVGRARGGSSEVTNRSRCRPAARSPSPNRRRCSRSALPGRASRS